MQFLASTQLCTCRPCELFESLERLSFRHPPLLRFITSFIDEVPVYERMREVEVAGRLKAPDGLPANGEITGLMRAMCVNWLVQVHISRKWHSNTLFMTVSLLDRYLSQSPVAGGQLQLVAVACTSLASKFEEVDPVDLRDWAHIAPGLGVREVTAMECTILRAVGFKLQTTTAVFFLDHLLALLAPINNHGIFCKVAPLSCNILQWLFA